MNEEKITNNKVTNNNQRKKKDQSSILFAGLVRNCEKTISDQIEIIDKAFDGFGDPLDILDPGIAIKQYPCCGSTHSAADVAIELYEDEKIPIDEIKHVDVWTHPRRLKHTNKPNPQGVLDAKFSVQYVVSRCLLEGRVVLEHFEEGAYNDPTVRLLMGLSLIHI